MTQEKLNGVILYCFYLDCIVYVIPVAIEYASSGRRVRDMMAARGLLFDGCAQVMFYCCRRKECDAMAVTFVFTHKWLGWGVSRRL